MRTGSTPGRRTSAARPAVQGGSDALREAAAARGFCDVALSWSAATSSGRDRSIRAQRWLRRWPWRIR